MFFLITTASYWPLILFAIDAIPPNIGGVNYQEILRDALSNNIQSILGGGDFNAAILDSKLLVQFTSTTSGENAWQTQSAVSQLATLNFASCLDRELQCELADAFASKARCDRLELEARLDEAHECVDSQCATFDWILGEYHPDYLACLQQQGRILAATSKYTDALSLLLFVAETQHETTFSDDPSYGQTLQLLADVLMNLGLFKEAEHYATTSLDVLAKAVSVNDPQYAVALRTLGRLYRVTGRYKLAERALRDSYAVLDKAYGSQHPETARTLDELGIILRLTGKHVESEACLREALTVFQKVFGKDHPETGSCLTELGSTLEARGDLVNSETALRAALSIHRTFAAEQPLLLAQSLAYLGGVLRAKGCPDAAESMQFEALQIREQVLGRYHVDSAQSIHNLSLSLFKRGDWVTRERLLNEALEIRRGIFGPDHPTIAENLNDLAVTLQTRGDGGCEALYREALAMSKTLLGADHPDVAVMMRNLAQLERRKGNELEAEQLSRQAIDSYRAALGDRHLRVASAYFSFAKLFVGRNDWITVESLAREALDIAEEHRVRLLGDERELAMFSRWVRLHDFSNLLTESLILLERFDEAVMAFERGHGRTLMDLLARADADCALSAGLSKATVQEPIEQAPDLASESSQPIQEKALRFSMNVATVQEIRAALRPGELMLIYDWTPFWAMLLVIPPKDSGKVEGLMLGERTEDKWPMINLADEITAHVSTPHAPSAINDVEDAIARLRQYLIPDKIRAQVESASTLIVVPSGALRQWPFELMLVDLHGVRTDSGALEDETNRFPTVVYADSATSFARLRCRNMHTDSIPQHQPSALILASPSFEFTNQTVADAYTTSLRGAKRYEDELSALETARLTGITFSSLPEARLEADAVAEMIRKTGATVEMLFDEKASISNLEECVQGKQLVHLASHGLTGSYLQPYDAAIALSPITAPPTDDDNFLTLNRLFRQWRGKLVGCELVVLSACDTNQGAIIGENTMALPGGFLYAGAESVIAAMWKVDDKATRLLMQRFYENYFGEFDTPRMGFSPGTRMTKAAALSEAKMWLWKGGAWSGEQTHVRGGLASSALMSGTTDSVYGYSHPYYWAGFVLVGEPD